MPYVRIDRQCIVRAGPRANICYQPNARLLVPDNHIVQIVALGCGERLTERGQGEAAESVAVDGASIGQPLS